jgi:hypothetical protein
MIQPKNEKEDYRTYYIVVFIIVLLVSVIATLLIYYFVRYKKRYYFDAAGRKFIISTGEYANLINKLIEIIQFDNNHQLEEEVISNYYNKC